MQLKEKTKGLVSKNRGEIEAALDTETVEEHTPETTNDSRIRADTIALDVDEEIN